MVVPRLESGQAQVWWARPLTLDADGPDGVGGTGRWARLLDDAEFNRRVAYRRDADRARFTVAAALLRLVAGAHLGVDPGELAIGRHCPDCDRPHGRPTLPGAGWECSVSHSGDRVAVVIGRTGPLGVDVEALDRVSGQATDTGQAGTAAVAGFTGGDGLRDYVLTAAEAADLDAFQRRNPAATPGSGLLAYWTRKEAVLKATGTGLRVGLRRLAVSAPDTDPRLLVADTEPGLPTRATLRVLDPGPGYLACLAALDTPTLTVTELDADPLLRGTD